MLAAALQPVAEGQAGGPHNISEKELEQRKGSAVTAWLVRNICQRTAAECLVLCLSSMELFVNLESPNF